MKYKWSILFMIVAVFILCNSIREGLTTDTIGEYEYLKPSPSPPTLDSTTVSKFITAYNNANKGYMKASSISDMDASDFARNATVEEFNYYIINNKWPYGSYISTYITNNSTEVNSKMANQFLNTTTPTLAMIQQLWPTRLLYIVVAKEKESKQTPTPMSYDIFMGTKPPPESTPPVSDKSSLSPDNYQKLQSICSSLVIS